MQVFKAYFRIAKKHRMPILIYLIVFLALSVVISGMSAGADTAASFSETKYNIAFFNEDAGEPIADELKQYLAQNAKIVDIGSSAQEVQDALFYGQAACVITVPKGFSESFISGSGGVSVEKMSASDMAGNVYTDFLVNKYLNMAALYADNMPGATQEEIARYVAADLNNAATLDYQPGSEPEDDNITYYFQFLAYSLLAMMMMGVSMVMMSLNEANISNRMACSPLRPVRMNMQIVLANAVFALAVWAVMCAFIFAFNGQTRFDTGTILLCLNALVFTVVSVCIGFLAGKLIKNHGVQAAVTNVVSLGMSFLSGVFVEQELLGGAVRTIGSFMPSYWYIRAVDAIRVMTDYSAGSLKPVIDSLLIQLGFAAAILIVTLAVSRQRRKASLAA